MEIMHTGKKKKKCNSELKEIVLRRLVYKKMHKLWFLKEAFWTIILTDIAFGICNTESRVLIVVTLDILKNS